jgi:hypothetical protein
MGNQLNARESILFGEINVFGLAPRRAGRNFPGIGRHSISARKIGGFCATHSSDDRLYNALKKKCSNYHQTMTSVHLADLDDLNITIHWHQAEIISSAASRFRSIR